MRYGVRPCLMWDVRVENLVVVGGALAVGRVIGFILGSVLGKGKTPAPVPAPVRNWWEERKTLTGTQLQLLQYMEAKRSASIAEIQEKFSFIPDRELYYRLEQICLMDFVARERRDGDVIYTLNPEYSETVEDDKTVMLDS